MSNFTVEELRDAREKQNEYSIYVDRKTLAARMQKAIEHALAGSPALTFEQIARQSLELDNESKACTIMQEALSGKTRLSFSVLSRFCDITGCNPDYLAYLDASPGFDHIRVSRSRKNGLYFLDREDLKERIVKIKDDERFQPGNVVDRNNFLNNNQNLIDWEKLLEPECRPSADMISRLCVVTGINPDYLTYYDATYTYVVNGWVSELKTRRDHMHAHVRDLCKAK